MKTAFRFCWSALCGFWHAPAILILMPFVASQNRLKQQGLQRAAALVGHLGHILAFAWMVQVWWLVGEVGVGWLLS